MSATAAWSPTGDVALVLQQLANALACKDEADRALEAAVLQALRTPGVPDELVRMADALRQATPLSPPA